MKKIFLSLLFATIIISGYSQIPLYGDVTIYGTTTTNKDLYVVGTKTNGAITDSALVKVSATGQVRKFSLNTFAWKLLGNTATNPSTNFIGTTDTARIIFRVKNTKFGMIDSSGCNSFGNSTIALGSYGVNANGYDAQAVGWGGVNANGYVTRASGNGGTNANGVLTVIIGDNGSNGNGFGCLVTGDMGINANGAATSVTADNGANSNGYQSSVSGSFGSNANGYFSIAKGHYGSNANGFMTLAQSYVSTAVGYSNNDTAGTENAWVNTDPIFMVGNGTKVVGSTDSLRNAFTILKNGLVLLDTVPIGTANKVIIYENGTIKYKLQTSIFDSTSFLAACHDKFRVDSIVACSPLYIDANKTTFTGSINNTDSISGRNIIASDTSKAEVFKQTLITNSLLAADASGNIVDTALTITQYWARTGVAGGTLQPTTTTDNVRITDSLIMVNKISTTSDSALMTDGVVKYRILSTTAFNDSGKVSTSGDKMYGALTNSDSINARNLIATDTVTAVDLKITNSIRATDSISAKNIIATDTVACETLKQSINTSAIAAYNASGVLVDTTLTAGFDSTKAWLTHGNSGTVAGTHFIGTDDDIDLIFKRNNVQAGLLQTGSKYNTSWGVGALNAATTGVNNNSFGYESLNSNTSGDYNNAFGLRALNKNTSGGHNTAVGHRAMFSNLTGLRNIGIGYQALHDNTSGNDNVAVGEEALKNNTTASNNTAIGYRALYTNSIGYSNTSIGIKSMYSNISGYRNTAVGDSALSKNTIGYGNKAFGYQALYNNIGGFRNIAIGYQSMYTNTSGHCNTAIGINSLYSNTTARFGIGIGCFALYNNTTGTHNIAIGDSAGYANTTDSNRLFINKANFAWNYTATTDTTNWKGMFLNKTTGEVKLKGIPIASKVFASGVDSLGVVTGVKYPMGYTPDGIVIDSIFIIQNSTGAGAPDDTVKVSFGTDIEAAGTAVVTVGTRCNSHTTVTKVSTFNNATIQAGRMIWFSFNNVASKPRTFYIQIKGH